MNLTIRRVYEAYISHGFIPKLIVIAGINHIDYGSCCTQEGDNSYTPDSVNAFRFKYGMFR